MSFLSVDHSMKLESMSGLLTTTTGTNGHSSVCSHISAVKPKGNQCLSYNHTVDQQHIFVFYTLLGSEEMCSVTIAT